MADQEKHGGLQLREPSQVAPGSEPRFCNTEQLASAGVLEMEIESVKWHQPKTNPTDSKQPDISAGRPCKPSTWSNRIITKPLGSEL